MSAALPASTATKPAKLERFDAPAKPKRARKSVVGRREMALTMEQIARARAAVDAVDPTDAQLLHDMIEGETDALALIDRLREAELMEKASADSLAEVARRVAERKAAAEKRAENLRKVIYAIAGAADVSQLKSPLCTVYLIRKPLGVVVTDPSELPQGFADHIIKPRLAEIRRALQAGEDVPGARLEDEAAETWAIR